MLPSGLNKERNQFILLKLLKLDLFLTYLVRLVATRKCTPDKSQPFHFQKKSGRAGLVKYAKNG